MSQFPHATLVVQDDEMKAAWWPDVGYSVYYILGDFADTKKYNVLRLNGDLDVRESTLDLAHPGPQSWVGFVALGVEHVLTGWAHLMFIAALLLGVTGLWRVLAIVTAFTVAHSVTLALAVLELAVVPASFVEPAIAGSIVWVALENVLAPQASARRWAVALAFGLVHGFGFAGALAGAGWFVERVLAA